MSVVTTRFQGGMRFENVARGHLIPSDQPLEAGGADEGPTPVELFLASLGSCAGVYAAAYCQAREIDPSGLEIRVEAEKVKGRLGSIKILVQMPPHLAEKDRKGIQQAVDRCLVKNTLLHPPEIETEFTEFLETNPI